MLDGVQEPYGSWAKEYEERHAPLEVPPEVIKSVYGHRTPTDEFAVALNPRQTLERLNSEIVQIVYEV